MSFPTIPDIHPDIDLDRCEAVDLLLASIAKEELSLSRLMDAEEQKIRCVLRRCETGGNLSDLTAVNKSVESMMKTLIKLQMLLQFKLENVRDFLPGCSTTTTCSTTTSTTTTCSCCLLMGSGRGSVENRADPLRGQPVTLHVFLPRPESADRSVRYSVGGEDGLRFYAAEKMGR